MKFLIFPEKLSTISTKKFLDTSLHEIWTLFWELRNNNLWISSSCCTKTWKNLMWFPHPWKSREILQLFGCSCCPKKKSPTKVTAILRVLFNQRVYFWNKYSVWNLQNQTFTAEIQLTRKEAFLFWSKTKSLLTISQRLFYNLPDIKFVKDFGCLGLQKVFQRFASFINFKQSSQA